MSTLPIPELFKGDGDTSFAELDAAFDNFNLAAASSLLSVKNGSDESISKSKLQTAERKKRN